VLAGEIIAKDWKKPFQIEAGEWGGNNKLAARISEQAGSQALFSTQDMDLIRLVSSVVSEVPRQKIVYSVFGVHPTAGFVSPTLTISGGKISPTADTGAMVNIGHDYAKAQRLDLSAAAEDELREIIQHLLTVYVDLQPRELTLPILAHAFLGPLLFGLNLIGEFPPYILFLVGSSGLGKTETAKLAQSIWGNFQVKEHLASWGSTPEINRQEGARCRGALWVIDDFKRQKIGQSQWNNAIRVLLDYADLQARKRATPGSKVITSYPMKCMLLVTGEDVPAAETALLARSLLIEFEGQKNMETFRKCLSQQDNYRKIPAPYIAWLQDQDRNHWIQQTRKYMDSFTDMLDTHNLTTDNSRRLASNAALSLSGLHAFLDFSQSIQAIDKDYADILLIQHMAVLEDVLKRMLQEVDDIKPVNCFISTLEELFRTKRVKIMDQYDEGYPDRNMPIIGYYKENRKYVCLFPRITMSFIRETFFRSEGEGLNFSNTAIGRQLVEEGYIVSPRKENTTMLLDRIPGAGKKVTPVRVWKFYTNKLKWFDNQGIADED
jgi:hypothetical protein